MIKNQTRIVWFLKLNSYETMQFKIPSSRIVVSIIIVCVVSALVLISFRYLGHEELLQAESQATQMDVGVVVAEEQVPNRLPTRIKIPKINLDAEIEYVGLTSSGEMATPESTRNVGWYEQGVRPGEEGSAVIAGHYGWGDGEASAFDELHKLRVGDRFTIEDDAGGIITFVVRANRRYDPGDDASDVFTSTDGGAHLNLITCEGDWDPVSKSYSKRLVVFADRE